MSKGIPKINMLNKNKLYNVDPKLDNDIQGEESIARALQTFESGID